MEDPPKHPEVAAIFARLLAELGLSGNQLAKSLNTSQQVISGYASGRTNPGREMLAAIIRRYPAINAAWLATGEGEPFPAGRFNEKPTLTPAATSALPTPGLTSGAATVAEAENILLRQQNEHLLGENARLWDMLGKSPGSSDAADSYPTHPLPVPQLRVQARRGRIGFRVGKGR